MPATSSNVTPISSWAYILPRLRPNAMGEPAPPSRRIMRKITNRHSPVSTSMPTYEPQTLGPLSLSNCQPCSTSSFGQPFVAGNQVGAERHVFGFAVDLAGDLAGDLPIAQAGIARMAVANFGAVFV